MRDGIAICVGKGNAEWNYSAPHGAERIMSRNAAQKNIALEEFEKSMEGIFATSVCRDTLDESPQAYKPQEEILRLVEPTAEVITMIKLRVNIKDISICAVCSVHKHRTVRWHVGYSSSSSSSRRTPIWQRFAPPIGGIMMRCNEASLQRRLRERYRSIEAICRCCKHEKRFPRCTALFFSYLAKSLHK